MSKIARPLFFTRLALGPLKIRPTYPLKRRICVFGANRHFVASMKVLLCHNCLNFQLLRFNLRKATKTFLSSVSEREVNVKEVVTSLMVFEVQVGVEAKKVHSDSKMSLRSKKTAISVRSFILD